MGDILDIARADAKEIVTEGGFETELTFTSPDAQTTITTKGLAIRRTDTLYYDNGSKSHSPFASITVPFDAFTFTTNYISLKNWTVSFIDSERTVNYKVVEILPNRTLGLINCTLKDG
jgi:hypothetical protein